MGAGGRVGVCGLEGRGERKTKVGEKGHGAEGDNVERVWVCEKRVERRL